MNFAWPEALPLLLLAPLAWFLLRVHDRARARKLERAVGPRSNLLAAELGKGRRSARRWLAAAAFLLALIAVMQPMWGEGLRKFEQRGVDILVCLDVSRSMLARDMPPTRLARARQEACALAGQLHGDRLGLVVFAGEARLTAPITQDMESFIELVEMADPLSVEQGGTDLGAALETALMALEDRTGEHEAVVLLTDGEDLKERGLSMAKLCRDRNITIYCVGFGSARGSKIAIENEEGGNFLEDRSGKEVITAMDPESLRRIAETTGGVFVDAGDRMLPLLKLYEKQILPMAAKSFDSTERRERRNRFQWPLLAAFLLWITTLCFTDRKVQ